MMRQRHLILILVVGWVAVCAWSIVSYQTTAPTDFGFTRGLNRVSSFLQIQIVAVVIAIAGFVLSFRAHRGSALRWVARGPLLLTLVVIAAFAVFVAVVIWNDPAQEAPATSPPVTEPADR
ncbi:MAG: hypothetical protein NXI27_12035 [Alphaproteobacteria bacterium]|nr:hypothetical protein [Alphaproteobacteria bacterium]